LTLTERDALRIGLSDLTRVLGTSRQSIWSWRREGLPSLTDSTGRRPEFDARVVLAWLRQTGRGQAFKADKRPVDLQALERFVAVQMSARIHRLFDAAKKALAATFAEVEPALRSAMRAVPEELRDQVWPLDFEILDRLTAEVRALDFEPAGEMSDDELDRMGDFWYQVAAGEIVVGPAGVLGGST